VDVREFRYFWDAQFTGDLAIPVNRLWHPWLRVNRVLRAKGLRANRTMDLS
jgi:hypothetical protein